MTLMKSLLLGSAATLVVVAGAQAADLPTKKGAPAAEYVKVCKVGDIAGFIIPGSDTCLKISGYVNAQIAVGNVKDECAGLGDCAATGASTSAAKYVSDIGFSTRGQVNFDAVTNTAMGPLLAHIEIQSNSGIGFDPLGNGAVLNAGYVQWAGITAGKHGSFYDYLAGGDTWKDFFSPDHSGTPINLLAYTASFGGGFSATLSLEQNELVSGRQHSASRHRVRRLPASATLSGTPLGVRAPDIVAALDVTQSWGGAHLAGVAHNVRVDGTSTQSATTDLDTWGYGVIGGVTFNLPMLSAGSKIAFQGAYAHGAIGYSGAGSPAWGEQDQGFNTNGNGTLFPMADAIYDRQRTRWTLSNAWSAAAQLTWKVSPNFEIDPEVAYASVDYGSTAATYWGTDCRRRRPPGGSARCSTGRRSRTSISRSTPSTSCRISRRRSVGPRGRRRLPATTRTASTAACTSSARSDRTRNSVANLGPGAKAPGFFVVRRQHAGGSRLSGLRATVTERRRACGLRRRYSHAKICRASDARCSMYLLQHAVAKRRLRPNLGFFAV